MRNLFKWPGYQGNVHQKTCTTSEDRDQSFIAHARINELKRLKRLKGKEADLFSETPLSILILKVPKFDTYDYRRMGLIYIYMAGVPICIGQHKAS